MRQSIMDHLGVHVPYELLMLRYTFWKLAAARHVLPPLDINAYIEAFAVHARNLLAFMANKPDYRDFKIKDVTQDFAPLSVAKSDELTKRLNEQIFHLSKKRTTNDAEKFDTGVAADIVALMEEYIQSFDAALRPEYRRHWHPERAKLDRFLDGGNVITSDQNSSQATSTSLPTVVTVMISPGRKPG